MEYKVRPKTPAAEQYSHLINTPIRDNYVRALDPFPHIHKTNGDTFVKILLIPYHKRIIPMDKKGDPKFGLSSQLLLFPPHAFTEEVVSKLIKRGCNIPFIPREKITEDHLKEIIARHPKYIPLFADRITSGMIYPIQIDKDKIYEFLSKCPHTLLTTEKCRELLYQDVSAFNYLPEHIREKLLEEFFIGDREKEIVAELKALLTEWNSLKCRGKTHLITEQNFEDIIDDLSNNIIKLYLENRKFPDFFAILCRHGRLSLLDWVVKRFNLTRDDITANDNWAFRRAAETGQLEVLQWIADRFNFDKTDATAYENGPFRWAAENGHLNVLKWLTARFGLTKEDATAHENRAFQWAAHNGHLDVLKWLTTEFKLTQSDALVQGANAFTSAAKNGHLDILVWLVDEFKLTKILINSDKFYWVTVTNGHIHILDRFETIFELRMRDVFSANIFRELIEKGQLKVLKWITHRFSLNKPNITSGGINPLYYSANRNQLEILKWLIDYFQFTRDEVLSRQYNTINGALMSKNEEILEWLYDTYQFTWEDVPGKDSWLFSTIAPEKKEWFMKKFKLDKQEQILA